MSVYNKVSSRAPAIVIAVAVALLAVFAPDGSGRPTEASHGGMDLMAIDLETLGNSSSAIGAIDTCKRINNNGTQDADEDFIDGLFVDIVADNIPAHNDNGTPGAPADDSGGITGYQYSLNYPPGAPFTVSSQEFNNPSVNLLAVNNLSGESFLNGGEPVPDNETNNRWESAIINTPPNDPQAPMGAPESGDGVLDRLALTADDAGSGTNAATTGQYLISLSNNVHVDAGTTGFPPHSTGLANIAVNQPCGTLITSYGYYHPVTPARILDTRTAPQGVPSGKVNAGNPGIVTVDVTGIGGVPATGVSAVVVNATVTQSSGAAASFLTVYPSGEDRPLASNLNFTQGQTIPNLVTVAVGPDGTVKVYNAAGQVHVIFDVVGWYGGPASGSRLNPLAPKRILDTRFGIGANPAPIGQNSQITVDVTDTFSSGVPASGVTAVVVNTTVAQATHGSFLTVWPADAAKPNASNLNFVGGQTVPNLVIVKVGGPGPNDGKVNVYNAVGQVHVIFDVVGWFGSASGDVFNPLPPSRVLDTRFGPPVPAPGAVGPSAELDVDVTVGNVPDTASSVVVNTTVTQPTAPASYLTVYPSNVSTPTASNLNFTQGQTVPNLVIVKTGPDGKVTAFNAQGQTHVIFDNVGYFAPVP